MAETGDQVVWELHAGGVMAVVAKIKPVWPRVDYNVILGWDPVFRARFNEDGLVAVDMEEMPALKDIPGAFFQKLPGGGRRAAYCGTYAS